MSIEIREPLPSDRIQPRERKDLKSPACCAVCGNGTCREGYLDLGVFYEWEGQVYLCWNCGLEAARALGCLSPDQSQYLINQNKEWAKELKELKEAHESATARLAVYDAAVASVSGSANSGTSEDSSKQQENAPSPSSTTGNGEPVSKKPVKSARRTDAKRTTVRDGITL